MCSALLLYINVHARTHTHTQSSWTSVLWSWNSVQQSPSWEANSSRLVKKFPAFCGARRFITGFTEACHLLLSWAIWINPRHPVLFIENSFYYYPPIQAGVFQAISFLQISPPKLLFPPPYMPHETRIFSLVRFVRSTTTDNAACHYAIIIDYK